jgi:uncharacterized protein with NAD-binding domain and iron-sulfur cluster
MTAAWTRRRGDRRRIVVVGAGVAGMTAAHELVERGYEVEVVEMAADPYDAEKARVGGMARTSWARVPSPPDQAPLGFASRATAHHPAPRAAPVSGAGTRITSDNAPLPITLPLTDALDGEVVREFIEALTPDDHLLVITSRLLKAAEKDQLSTALGDHPLQLTVAESGATDERVQISVAGARVPGEHGFRFFPSFYHHLFDTMKRIPIPEAAIGKADDAVVAGVTLTSDSARSVFDALLSADVIQLGLEPDDRGSRSFEITRRPVRALHDLRKLFGDVLERAGYRGKDLYRLITRYAEYLTSSSERRLRYEDISWAEFLGLGGGGYSPTFMHHVNSGAQALVAMSSATNDARTIGSIAMQLTLDQLRENPGGYTDATLRGPTSIELFEPWRRYLESQSVRFTRGQLVGFYGHGMAVRPAFGVAARAGVRMIDIDPADYYVITIPVDKIQSLYDRDGEPTARWSRPGGTPRLLSRDELRRASAQCTELDRLEREDRGRREPGCEPVARPGEHADDVAKYLDFDVGDPAGRPDDGPLRYMCGVQFYFESDVKMILGHTLCLDSPWGVSHISQVQYWQDRARGQSGVRGVISAIFTLFTVPAPDRTGQNFKTALACDPDEVAERVWKQISDAWDSARYGVLPAPDYYYIDESLQHRNGTWENATPYLVNRVGDWSQRGGVRTQDGDYDYRIQLGHTVFAGVFMRTHTRLNTMEAANESGRRAANAILAHDRVALQRARLWKLEDHELADVAPLRELDRRIVRRGGHHLLRHAGVEAALRAMPWDLARLFVSTGGDDR